MSLEQSHIQVNDFGSPRTRLEPSDVRPPYGLLSLNSEYNPGQVSTRKGFDAVYTNLNEPCASLFHWVSSLGTWLFRYNATSGNVGVTLAFPYNISSGYSASIALGRTGAAGCTFATGGVRAYGAFFDTSNVGVGQGVVFTYDGSFHADALFPPPLTTKPTLGNTGSAGNVTGGIHRVGYVIQSRSGALGKICPVISGSTFDITSQINSAASDQISFSLTITPTADAKVIYPVMTTADNPNRFYYVPGKSAGLTPGSPQTVAFTLDISDADLASTAEDATGQFNLLTQAAGGTGPFNPNFIAEYGQRMVYGASVSDGSGNVPTAYFSEPDNHQHITADQHGVVLPGQRTLCAGFQLGSVFYLLGPHWTYAVQDTGDVPALWPTAQLVDGAIGAMGPKCVCQNAAQGFAAVAHTTGLYIFSGGTYTTRPLSYFVDPDWKRINLPYASTIQVVDNKDKQQIYVLVPLDSATAPSHIMMFDYSNGLTPESVKYSLWSISGTTPTAGCMVQHYSTKLSEFWIAAGNNVWRQKVAPSDATPYNDNTAAISWTYETCPLPGMDKDIGRLYHFDCEQIRAHGAGSLSCAIYGPDRARGTSWTTAVTLSTTPAQIYTKSHPRLRGESASFRFSTNAANQYCVLSAIDVYYGQGPAYR